MLQSYHEEVRRKRNAYRVFWIAVFAFAFLLYMFFQGYYFSVRLGFQELMHPEKQTASSGVTQVVRSFGIVNVRVDPNPSTLTVNDQPYQNGAKSIFDYGEYRIDIEEPQYVPIHIKTVIDKQNPFYINIIRLLKTPKADPMSRNIESIESLGNGKYLAKTASGSVKSYEVFDETISTGSTLSGATSSGTYLGDKFFRIGDKLATYDDATDSLHVYDKLKTQTGALCADLKSVRGDLFCPSSGTFLTGRYASLKDRVLEATDRIIRTKNSILQNGGGFFSTTYSLTGSLDFSGATDLVRLDDETLLLASGKLWRIEKDFSQKIVPPFTYIDRVANFPDETLIFGRTSDDVNAFSLVDARGNTFLMTLPQYDFEKVTVTKHSGAYLINTGKAVFLYYKGGTGVTQIAEGQILGIFDRVILYGKDGKTYRMELEGVE